MNSKLIILHGWAYSTEKWRPFLKLLEQNKLPYELLKIPGLTAPLNRIWTLNDYVGWLDKKTSKDKGKFILVGHSNGGRIACAYAAKYPEKVESLILIDSAGIVHGDFRTQLKKLLFGIVAKLGKNVMQKSSIKDLLYKAIGEQDYNKADPILKKTMVSLISRDLSAVFSKIKVPTLIIWGENDKVTPTTDGKKIHELISGSELSIIKGAKHSPQYSHPNVVFELINKRFRG